MCVNLSFIPLKTQTPQDKFFSTWSSLWGYSGTRSLIVLGALLFKILRSLLSNICLFKQLFIVYNCLRTFQDLLSVSKFLRFNNHILSFFPILNSCFSNRLGLDLTGEAKDKKSFNFQILFYTIPLNSIWKLNNSFFSTALSTHSLWYIV